jgi:O-antigen/teichoic acid export membrane protein
MSLRNKAAKGSLLLAVGAAVGQISSLVRNIILAQLLTKADFGIAATFAMVITLLEFSAKLGISRFVVQDPNGGSPDFIASAHLLQFTLAMIGGLMMLVVSPILANLFGIPEYGWALRLLSLVAFCRGVEHLDISRFERDLRFGPSTQVEAGSQVITTLLAWPISVWFGDFRAVLALLILRSVLCCAYSHWVAEIPYRWNLNFGYLRRMMRFGWPLLVNGFLMFGILQGDQFLVATFYTMADLGPYAAAAALALAPTFFFGRVFNSVMLPLISKVQADPEGFRRRYTQALAVLAGFAVVCTVGVVVGSESIMQIIYGAKYAGSGPILAWLSAATAFRNLRIAPALAALARGDTQNQMRSNIWRLVAILPAVPLALGGYPVWMIACTGLLGEFLACTASFQRLRSRDGIALSVNFLPTAAVLGATFLAILASRNTFLHDNPFVALPIAAGASIASGIVIAFALPPLRAEAKTLAVRLRGYAWRLP